MDIALDLGTSNIRIKTEKDGVIIDEPSVIAYDVDTSEIISYGQEAYRMLGKTSNRINVVFPLEGGVIAESGLVEELINTFMCDVCKSRVVMPRIVACIPGEITEVEKRAVVNAISSFGVRRVLLIETTKAAAFGCSLDIMSPHGVMLADMGAGTVDVAVMTLGGVAVAKTIKNAGNSMDDEIIKYARRKHNLIIGKAMAKECKESIACVIKPEKELTFRLKGRDALRGLPKWVDVTSSEIMHVIASIGAEIINGIVDILEETPPELIGDVNEDGITITGGLSKIYGMKELLEKQSGIKVHQSRNPQNAVIDGCYKATSYIEMAEQQKSNLNPLIMVY